MLGLPLVIPYAVVSSLRSPLAADHLAMHCGTARPLSLVNRGRPTYV